MRIDWYIINISGLIHTDVNRALQTYKPKNAQDKLWWEEAELGNVPACKSWVIHSHRKGARKARRYLRRHFQKLRAWGMLSKRTGFLQRPVRWTYQTFIAPPTCENK